MRDWLGGFIGGLQRLRLRLGGMVSTGLIEGAAKYREENK